MTTEIGEEAEVRILESAAEQMRCAIVETGGREVFFAGSLSSVGLLEKARVCARGHEGAVPAFLEALAAGEVVLHNHPGDDIAPSDADLNLSSLFGFHGHGFYIVNNSVTRVYVVVEPFVPKLRQRIEPGVLLAHLRPGGRLARLLTGFEVRPQQAAMLESVADAFNEDGMAVIEAPTGVGKTVAYLLPAVAWAQQNQERVVISTRTINLQEQIMLKDLPQVAKCFEKPITAVLVKGRGNYLCWRKLEAVLAETTLFDDADPQLAAQRAILKSIDEWSRVTQDGSLSDLPFVPPRDLWDRICSESDTCRPVTCPTPKRCFIGRARREVVKADILVVNHHMLFSDLAIKKEMGTFSGLAVLPAYQRVIFDEAHNIEDAATEYFGADATRIGSLALLGRLVRMERGRERGLLPYLKVKMLQRLAPASSQQEFDAVLDLIGNQLLPAVAAAREALTAAFGALRSLTAERCGQIGRDIKWRLTQDALLTPELREIHAVYVLPAAEEVQHCAQLCESLRVSVKKLAGPADEVESPYLTEILQLDAYGERLRRLANVLTEATDESLKPNTVRWIEIDAKNPHFVRLARCPLDVGGAMAEWVYPNLKTIVMTSATLSVQRSFTYLSSRIGLDRVPDREVTGKLLDSPFDFERQALLCVPTDLPSPDEGTFLDASVECIRRILAITRGHAMALFTSFYALDYSHRRLEAELTAAGITPLKQGAAARTPLLERFRSDTSSVLFATDSFWEGVDVAGEALQCVILPKLPFRVPTEPVLEARAEAIELAGGNAFMEYTVPQAVIRFRQGFGRLIRRKTDRGAIVVLDRRVMTKRYGKVFMDSLPGARIVTGRRADVYAELGAFFTGLSGP